MLQNPMASSVCTLWTELYYVLYTCIHLLGTNSSEEQRAFNTKGTAPEKSRWTPQRAGE